MKTRLRTQARSILTARAAVLLILGLLPAGTLHAQTGTWTGAGGATWNTTATNWSGVTGTPWDATNGLTGIATFDGANTPSVSGTVYVNQINKSATAGNTTISSGTIFLAGSTPTITNNSAGGLTISSILSGTTGLTKSGAGTLTLNGSNAYTGITAINAGRLDAGNSSALGTGNVTIASGAFFGITGGGTFSNNFTVAGAAGNGNGAIQIFNSSATLSGPIALSADATIGQRITSSNNTLTISGGITTTGGANRTLTLNNFNDGTRINNAITINTNSVNVGSGGTLDLGAGILATGTGTYNLNVGNNTWGTVLVRAAGAAQASTAILNLGATNALGGTGAVLQLGNSTSAIDVTTVDLKGFSQTIGGLRSFTGSGTTSANGTRIVTNSGGAATLTVSNTTDYLYDGQINGAIALTKTGASTLTLSGSTAHSGGTLINAGVLALGGANALPTTGTITFGGGTLRYGTNNNVDYSAGIVSSGSAISIDTNSQTVTFASPLAASNTGGLTKLGSGTLSLSATNAYTGTTAINSGVLALGSGSALGTSGTVAFGGGTLQYTAQSAGSDLSSRVANSSSAISIDTNSQTVTFTSPLAASNTGGLTKLGSGTLSLSATNAYTGTTAINSGVLSLGSGSALGTSGTVTFGGGTLQYTAQSAGSDISPRIAGSSSAISIDTNNQTVNWATLDASNTGGLAKSGSGSLTISGGTLALGASAQIINNTPGLTGASTLTIGSRITSATNFFIGGYGTTILSGSNSLSGTVTIGSGSGGPVDSIVRVTNSGALNGAAAVVLIGGSASASSGQRLELDNNVTVAGPGLTLNSASNQRAGLWVAASNTAAWNGDIGSAGSGLAALWAQGSLTVGSGTTTTFNTSVTIRGSGTGTMNSSIVGAGLSKTDAGTWIINSASNAYNGTTTISNGTLQFASIADASSPSAIGTGSTISFGQNVAGAGGVGTMRFTGAAGGSSNRTISITTGASGGGATIESAVVGQTLTLSGSVTTTSSSLGTLTLTGSGNGALSGNIAPTANTALNLTKAGSGTWTLSGSNAYTGTTSVNAGTLSFASTAALQGTSGVTINGGAGLTYTGGAATLAKNITVTAGSGTGTIRNTGSGLLTLSGNLSKDNSVLRLTGGRFDVTGTISGATVGKSDLLVDGTSTVTLSAVNTYNGPTFVNQASNLIVGINNAIPSNSTVTLGDASSRGTLDLGTFTDAIGGLVFTGSGGTVKMAANQTASPQVSTSAALSLGSNASLDLTGMGTTAGRYQLISYTSNSGTFGSVSGLASGYRLVYGTTQLDAQQQAVLGAVSVTNPAVAIITGGSAAFTYSVANGNASGGASLVVTGTGLSNVIGTSSGTAVGGGSTGSLSGLVFTGTSVGNNQQGTFSVNTLDAFGATTSTGTVAVTVLDHATSSLTGGPTASLSTVLNLGTWDYGINAWTSGTNSGQFSIFNLASTFGAGLTADLSLLSVSGTGNGFTTNLNTYTDIAGGSSRQYSVFVNPTSFLTSGTQSVTFTIAMGDKTGMAGATATNTLSVTANVVVVPEPGAIALAGIGIAAAWALRRRTA